MRWAYKAILHGNRVEWLDSAPEAEGPVPIYFPGKEIPERYKKGAVLNGNSVKWLDGPPEADEPVQTYVIILDKDKPDFPENRGAIMAGLLEILGDLGAFADIEDPVAWQREQRKDRPMPFRDYDVD